MHKKLLKSLLLVLCCLLTAISLVGCGTKFEVDLGIGDGSKEDEAVRCHYVLDGSIKDDYVIKGWFSAEPKADLNDRFVFSISFDERFSSSFHENVLFAFDGKQLSESQNGKLQFEIKLGKLSDTFEKTDTPKEFAFHFHRESAKTTDITKWSDSSYTYTFDGTTAKFDK